MKILKTLHRLPPDTRILEGFISGGSFRQYLRDAASDTAPFCLYLRPAAYGFHLPCADGQGTQVTESFSGGQFSESLCAFFLWSDGKPYDAILYDNEESIQRKIQVAETCGVAYCCIEQ